MKAAAMQPVVIPMSLLVADTILAGGAVEESPKVPAYPGIRDSLKRAHRLRHHRRVPRRTLSRKGAPLPPER